MGIFDRHEGIVVPVLGIHDLLLAFPELDDVSFVKIDVEGSERDIIPAMADFLRSKRPTMLLSIHPYALTLNEQWSLLTELRAICPYLYGLYGFANASSKRTLRDFALNLREVHSMPQVRVKKMYVFAFQVADPADDALCTWEPQVPTASQHISISHK